MLMKTSKLEEMKEVDMIEFSWMQRCNRGSIIKLFCEAGKPIESHGYDFELTYPTILSTEDSAFIIPKKRGQEKILTELDLSAKFKKGYYRVLISSEDENFNKIFCHSENHVYCDISVYQAYQYKKKYNAEISIALIKDDKPNA
jgi:hypothetical protein